jgi:uncharacterized protein (DUF427 family)
MKTPDENHPITFERESARVSVLFEGHEIAESDDVVLLREAGYPPVRYFPRQDVRMMFLRRTDKITHCPYKGAASYFTINRDGQVIDNAVWSYEEPFPAVGAIGDRVAFYPQHVEFKIGPLTAAQTQALDVDDVVLHTDSGSGASQAGRWAPTVDVPDGEAVKP